MARRAARVDTNQASIVEELRARGFLVAITHRLGGGFPDIVVAGRDWGGTPQVLLVEIKSKGGRLTPAEKKFMEEWRVFAIVAYSVADILRGFGLPDSALGDGEGGER